VIVSPEYEYVFVEVPRTGSRAVRHWLQAYYCGQVVGPWAHHVNVPEAARSHHTWAVVRDPVQRASSLWSWFFDSPDVGQPRPAASEVGGTGLLDFARWLGSERWREANSPNVRSMVMPQGEMLSLLRVDRVVRHETLPAGLSELPWVAADGPTPQVYDRSPKRPAVDSGLLWDLLGDWAEADGAFGLGEPVEALVPPEEWGRRLHGVDTVDGVVRFLRDHVREREACPSHLGVTGPLDRGRGYDDQVAAVFAWACETVGLPAGLSFDPHAVVEEWDGVNDGEDIE